MILVFHKLGEVITSLAISITARINHWWRTRKARALYEFYASDINLCITRASQNIELLKSGKIGNGRDLCRMEFERILQITKIDVENNLKLVTGTIEHECVTGYMDHWTRLYCVLYAQSIELQELTIVKE